MNIAFKTIDLAYQAPLLILVAIGLVVILAEAFFKGERHAQLMGLAVLGSAAALLASVLLYRTIGDAQRSLMGGMLVADKMAYFFTGLFSASTLLAALISPRHQQEYRWDHGEYYGLLLLAAAGMVMLAMAGDLVTVFIGVETMSLAVYVLTASRRRSKRAAEAAMKYFLMGAFASGFLLYGMALVYGAAGTTDLAEIARRVPEIANQPIMVIGVLILVVAFGFKVAAVPFHMWAPDAYEGAPTPVTAFMAAAVKAGAFAAMLRVFGEALGAEVMAYGKLGWASPVVVIAALTMTIGNIAALRQDNIKRMLAYSSISHAGILLTGLAAVGLGAETARSGMMYYLLAYSVTTMGAFGVVAWIGSRDRERVMVDDWAGLASKHPAAALAMTIFMLSLGGLPPTAGFFGKFYVFKAAMEVPDSQLLWLVVVGVLNSAVSIYYYLRVVTAMYFKPATDEFQPLQSGAVAFALVVCAAAVLEMGLLPGYWLGLTN